MGTEFRIQREPNNHKSQHHVFEINIKPILPIDLNRPGLTSVFSVSRSDAVLLKATTEAPHLTSSFTMHRPIPENNVSGIGAHRIIGIYNGHV